MCACTYSHIMFLLGAPGIICGFDIDTSFFTGNYAPKVSLQGTCLEDGMSDQRNRIKKDP